MTDETLHAAVRFHQAGNLQEAGRLYSDILRMNPGHLEALYRLALVHFQSGRFQECEQLLTSAVRRYPEIPEFHYLKGCALQNLRRNEEALASFARALSLKPDYVEARNNRGVTLLNMKRYQDALDCFQAINVAEPYGRALVFNNRAAALLGLKRYAEALDNSEKSLALSRENANALSTHGAVLMALGRYEDALAAYDHALRLAPDFVEAINNRGSALRELKRLDEALISYDRALALKPDFADARNNRGMLRLLVGRFREGWLDHEWRWEAEEKFGDRPEINARPWQGEDLNGRTIAVYSEQGLGDIIHFARYLPLVVARGAKVTFCAPANLIRLLRPVCSQINVVSAVDGREPFDFQCALMSLPLWFGTELHSVPNDISYITAETDLVTRWKEKLGDDGFRIGIAWQGAPGRAIDQGRSIPLAEFVPLSLIPGVRLISLQKTHGLDQLANLPADAHIETLDDEFDSGPDAFIDTAAIMSHLDLIITSDTSMAHVAGALGRPTWVALKYVPDWRWLLDRDDSPWYPTLRLFRQDTAGDWTSVFAQIARELRSLVA